MTTRSSLRTLATSQNLGKMGSKLPLAAVRTKVCYADKATAQGEIRKVRVRPP